LSPGSWDEIYTSAKLSGNREYPYGFGWNIGQSQGMPWYHHSGSSQGFHLYISRYLSGDLTIVVLTNLYEDEPRRFVDGIAEIMDPQIAKVLPSAPEEN
jgi:hypothetical protein